MITVKKHLRKRKNGASVVRQHLKKKKRYNKGNAPGGNLHKNSVSDGADKFLKSFTTPIRPSPADAKKKASIIARRKSRSYMLKSHKSKNIHLTISGRGQGKKGRTKNQKGEIKTRIRSLKAKK